MHFVIYKTKLSINYTQTRHHDDFIATFSAFDPIERKWCPKFSQFKLSL